MDNRCIVCGAIIPEGRMVCPYCERVEPMQKKQRRYDMISAWWLVPALMAGAFLGILILALCSGGR